MQVCADVYCAAMARSEIIFRFILMVGGRVSLIGIKSSCNVILYYNMLCYVMLCCQSDDISDFLMIGTTKFDQTIVVVIII